jgi:hypothetical protein
VTRAKKPAARSRAAKPVAKPDPAQARELATARKQLERANARIAELEAEPQPSAPPAALADFKTPPKDPLAAQAELHRMLVVSAYDAASDGKITAEQRRKEIRTITASAAKLFPDARRWEAEQVIKADRRELEKKASERRGAKLVPRPQR